MKLELVRSRRFKKSYKRVSKQIGFKRDVFLSVLKSLTDSVMLDQKYRDHALSGDMLGYRECHLAPDTLLIYEIDDGVLTLTLINIGSHSQLFK